MDWTKILSKGWIYVVQTIVVIAVILVFVGITDSRRKQSDLSVRKDIASAREQLVILSEQNGDTIELVTGVIDSNERVIDGLDNLRSENRRATIIADKLEEDNSDFKRRVRLIQDRSLESELVTDGIRQVIRDIELENGYNRD